MNTLIFNISKNIDFHFLETTLIFFARFFTIKFVKKSNFFPILVTSRDTLVPKKSFLKKTNMLTVFSAPKNIREYTEKISKLSKIIFFRLVNQSLFIFWKNIFNYTYIVKRNMVSPIFFTDQISSKVLGYFELILLL